MTRKSTPPILSDDTPLSSDAIAAAESAADARADRVLVDRCLAGDVAAWEQLYNQFHSPLCAAIKSLMSGHRSDPNVVDEIAARVWYALVKDDGQLLERFDPGRDLRLGAFLRGLARIEIMQYFRAEHRRNAREAEAGRRPRQEGPVSHYQLSVMLTEFTATLTPGEQQFLEEYLLTHSPEQEDSQQDESACESSSEQPCDPTSADRPELSAANIWQRRHRIRSKLRAFFHNG